MLYRFYNLSILGFSRPVDARNSIEIVKLECYFSVTTYIRTTIQQYPLVLVSLLIVIGNDKIKLL
jgi:hypothetical protein